jgi:DNA-nicking Smr family endonuclease
MGKRRTSRRQRRMGPDLSKPHRKSWPGAYQPAESGREKVPGAPGRRHQTGLPPAEKQEKTFTELFLGDQTAQESFSDLVEESLAAPDARQVIQERQRGTGARPPARPEDFPPPQEELDLHRRTGLESERSIENFIQTARGRGLLTLRIITGKGLHSQGPAVLPEVTEVKLLELKERRLVLAYRWERKKKERSGAIIVYLRPLR